jgi:phosphoglycolate phosphatase
MKNIRALFFDLDGTLMDSREGIVKCFAYAVEKTGGTPPPLKELEAYIGPPIMESLIHLVGKERAQEALNRYSERYVVERRGIIENRIYDGAPEALAALAPAFALYVVTSKHQPISRAIVEHFALMPFFRGLYGPLEGERAMSKEALIARVLQKEGLAANEAIMVGDRHYDLNGAKANSVKAVAAAWGYGARAELEACGPEAILEAPADLPGFFLS